MHKIDWPVFAAAVTCLCAATLPLAIAPDASASVIQSTYRWVAQALGPLYLWAGTLTFFFVSYLALSRHGRVVLGPGPPDPEFDDFSWFSMLFCAGIASGLLYWGVIEWAYYYQAPPYGAEVGSPTALEWATSYPLFHWGFTAWSFYALPTVAIAYACHRRGEGSYRLSTACRPLLGSQTDGFLGRAIDVFFIVGILGGAGTSLGLSTPMLAEGTAQLFGWVRSYALDVAIVLGCAVIFSISVYIGLERGIRILSNANLVLSLGLIALVLVAGDTLFILEASTSSIGHVLQNFFRMNLWAEPFMNTGFVEDWTVFYWAWWIAYAPFIGLFVARISRGRTVRQVVLGMLLLGTAGSWIFFMVLGNYALGLQLSGELPVVEILDQHGAPTAIIAVVSSLPLTSLSLGLFCVIALLYLATTFDSAAYTISSGASRDLGATGHPSRGHRSFWALAVAVLPIALMAVGGLKSLQTVSLVASVPLLGVGVLLALSLLRRLRDEPADSPNPDFNAPSTYDADHPE
ncbi:MAG: BCCT family transporter [Myxococcota bacterium]|nr:BCCT family transporter [Myxococcota bacterium]